MFLSPCHLVGLCLFLAVGGSPASYREVNQASEDSPHLLSRHKRFLVTSPHLWPKAFIPYQYEDSASRHEIQRVIDFIEDKSCLRFLPAKTTNRHMHGISHNANITFYKGNGCFSGMGFSQAGVRTSCCTGEACLHEIGHALGFAHEQENPKRDGWIEVNMDVIPDTNKAQYIETSADNFDDSHPYDITTMMHYFPVEFTKGKPAYALSFPELSIGQQYFYFFKEMADGYKCKDKPQCQGRTLQCENDGFQTILHGKCVCECPTGLDPDNLCKTPLKKVTSSWPKGQYALPKTKDGCPQDGQFQDGQVTQTGIGNNYMSNPYDLMGQVVGRKAELHFCTRAIQDDVFDTEDGDEFNWPLGNYCIYKKGNKCPTGFDVRSIQYHADSFVATGQTPEMTSGHIQLCCQFRGFPKEPASFPTDKPFALIKYGNAKCQKVTGMRPTIESFTIKSSEPFTVDSLFSRWLRERQKTLTVPICYYKPVDMNCGDVRTLTKWNRETTIEMSGLGQIDAECTWVVKGDTNRGTLVLDFEEFNVKKYSDICVDKVEVRHAMIGQHGQEYCGEIRHSIRSITDKLLVRFFTSGNSHSSFKARIKWIPFDDMCYNVDQRGVEYDGGVDYTRRFKPCLPWAEMTECPHNPFLMERYEQLDQLEGNACRNPDNSFRPWCYTDKSGCQRNYCDVCGIETPYDVMDNCQKLKAQGYCTKNIDKAIQFCAATCHDEFPNRPLTKKYTDVSCGRPTAPTDGSLIGSIKSSYKLGETVDYRCNSGRSVVTSRCMTSGQWSKVASACRACPPDYAIVGNKCMGVPKDATSVTYYFAAQACRREGGIVAAPRSREEANQIRKIAKNMYIWIGMTDTVTEGQWLYEDSTPVVWTNWDTSEPNNVNNEDYVVMKSTTKWMDVPEYYTYPFVCEIPKWEVTSCHDALGDQCQSLMTDRPSLCQELPDFAKEFCRKSCGICHTDHVQCHVGATKPNVMILSGSESVISVGKFVRFGCRQHSFRVKGDVTRACLLDGTLSGEPLECSDCPTGFISVENECHGLLGGELHTLEEARVQCGEIGGFVAMPKTKVVNDAISSLEPETKLWIGATDSSGEMNFVWEDRSSVYWSNWAQGEPKSGGEMRDCVAMSENKEWVTVDCVERLTTVCTIPKPASCLNQEDRGISYDGDVNHTRTHQSCLPWVKVTHCPHHPFNKGDELDNLVGNACRNPDNSNGPWCYTHKDGCKRNYCDVCGKDTATHCGPPTPPSDAIVMGERKPQYNVGDTVKYKCNAAPWATQGRCMTSGQWSQTGYACTECPIGFSLSADKCYASLEKKHTYREAVDACKEKGAVVAMPAGKEEAKHINGLSNSGGAMWLGMSDEKTEGTWATEDGTEPSWTDWGAVEPNGKRGENCVMMPGRSRWVDVPCNYRLNAVCSSQKLRCPVGFTLFGDSCYKTIDETNNYKDAVAACKAEGSVVAVPRTKEEAEHIASLTQSSTVWVGVSDEKVEGLWVAEDGTEAAWTNWNEVEPNGERRENCVLMFGGAGWVDVPCSYQLQAVCVTPDPEGNKCKDYLLDQCPKLLADKPTMCQDLPDFAGAFCAGTCGVCGGDDVSCPVENLNPSVELTTSNAPITTGQFVGYRCTDNTRRVKGNAVRACLPNGMLTGEPLQCGDCPEGFRLVGNACHGSVSERRFTFPQAREECERIGGFVAMPKSIAENDAINSLGDGNIVWIGATDSEDENSFMWEDGTKLNWRNWVDDNLEAAKEEKDCVAMSNSKQWLNVPCEGFNFTTICTIPLQASQDCAGDLFGETCYTLVDKQFTYEKGVTECRKTGGSLAAPKSSEENQFIQDIAERIASNNKDTWLGINDKTTEGTWVYAGHQGGQLQWTNWNNGEPNDYGKGEDCGVMLGDGKWNDASCSYTYPIICGVTPMESQVKCASPTPPSDGKAVGLVKAEYNVGDTMEWRCVWSDWSVFSRCMANGEWSQSGYACLECPGHFFNGNCYTVVDKALTYDNAVAECQQTGATVVAPKSKRETDFISKLLDQPMAWIGITDRKEEGNWVYQDGTQLVWTNWNPAEPNNVGPQGEDCAAMVWVKWIDVPCNYRYRTVCVKKFDSPQ